MVRRTKAEAEQTRETLLDAAELLFAERGIADTSLEDIAKACGVTRGALYWHFDNKYALFEAIYARAKLPMNQMMDATITPDAPLASLEKVSVYCLKHMARDERMQRVFTIMMSGCDKSEPTQCAMDGQMRCRTDALNKIENVLKVARKKGELASHVKPSLAATALISYMNGLYSDYLRSGKQCPPIEKEAVKLMQIFFKGLRS